MEQNLIGAIAHTIRTQDKDQARCLGKILLHLQPAPESQANAYHAEATPKESVCFCFDIDGVLLKGATPLDYASETLLLLQKFGFPFIFLTNGGGLTEEEHVAKLGARLCIPLSQRQFIQSHTPFYNLVPEFYDKNVLVLGGEQDDKIRELAHSYGFQKVVTASDLATIPNIWPFGQITENHHKALARPLPLDRPLTISAILVFSSPRDWGLDLQLIRDLLLSEKGQLGTTSKLNGDHSLENHGYQQDSQPTLHFCNPDLSWPTGYSDLRFAQGAFKAALEGIWNAETKGKATLISFTVGKPHASTFIYAEKLLEDYRTYLYSREVHRNKKVYMIDDNPASGIAGANQFTEEWSSILVESGVHTPGTKPEPEPTITKKDVKEAVEWAMKREGWYIPPEAWIWAGQVCDGIRQLQKIVDSPQLEVSPTSAGYDAQDEPEASGVSLSSKRYRDEEESEGLKRRRVT